jgi:hypothetical protein
MPTVKQTTVLLENKPGRLAQILSELARQKVNIIALSVMDRTEHGVLRLVTEDTATTVKAIQDLNAPFAETEVLAVDLKNQPGALAHVCEVLAAERINIDYAYCSSGGRNGRVVGIFKITNIEKAQRVLAEPPTKRSMEKRVLRDQRSYRKV